MRPAVLLLTLIRWVTGVWLVANSAPISSASSRNAAKELLLPSGPGLTANTMPWPQWLAAVFAACSQCIQMG